MLSLKEYTILESHDYDYIFEALGGAEIKKNLEISKISAKDTEKLIMSKEYGGGKQFDADDVDEIWAFNDVTHYAFKYKNDILAIIGLNNFYNLIKEQRKPTDYIISTLLIIPLLVLNDISLDNISLDDIFDTLKNGEKSADEIGKQMYDLMKKCLYVCELQINKETIKKHDLGVVAPLFIVFDWVKKYSNDNWILCAGKDDRTANMYKKVGKFWNITSNDKYSKKLNEYIKEWSKEYNNTHKQNRYSPGEVIIEDIKENMKHICILKK